MNTKNQTSNNLQSDTTLYKNYTLQNKLDIQKKLLTLSTTSEFISRNINNPLVQRTAVTDLYYLIQELHQLIENVNMPSYQID